MYYTLNGKLSACVSLYSIPFLYLIFLFEAQKLGIILTLSRSPYVFFTRGTCGKYHFCEENGIIPPCKAYN